MLRINDVFFLYINDDDDDADADDDDDDDDDETNGCLLTYLTEIALSSNETVSIKSEFMLLDKTH